VPQLQES
jgi:hypothetical protein